MARKYRRDRSLEKARSGMTANGEWDPSEPWQVQQYRRMVRGVSRRRGGRVVLLVSLLFMVAIVVGPLIAALMR